jgi:hypothetical protein
MCSKRALSPCFSALVILIDVSYSSKGLSDCCMCLANLDKRKMCLERALSPCISA